MMSGYICHSVTVCYQSLYLLHRVREEDLTERNYVRDTGTCFVSVVYEIIKTLILTQKKNLDFQSGLIIYRLIVLFCEF